jgi:hypothetical protein
MEKWICSKTALTKVNNFLAHTHCGLALRQGTFALISLGHSIMSYGLDRLTSKAFTF